MPELPEVEFNRLLVDKYCLRRRISAVDCVSDELVFKKTTSKVIEAFFLGRMITGTGRHGKYFWLVLSDSGLRKRDQHAFWMMHLGMTGFLQVKGHDRTLYRAAPERQQSAEWPPRFTKLRLSFEDGTELAFGDARRLGRAFSASDPEVVTSTLGFDPIHAPPSQLDAFPLSKKTPIKSMLLDQSFVAGIGNWMADDILHMAGILPQLSVGRLSEEQLDRLLRAIVDLSRVAVDLKTKGMPYPPDWIFHVRWQHNKVGSTFVHHGTTFKCIKVGGRTTFYAPSTSSSK